MAGCCAPAENFLERRSRADEARAAPSQRWLHPWAQVRRSRTANAQRRPHFGWRPGSLYTPLGVYATRHKEQFSLAFIQAVAAAAGCNVARVDVDEESVDLELIGPHDAADLRPAPHLALQAKCTALDDGCGDALPFPLKLKNYDDLRARCHVPRLLVVVCVPADVESWLTATPEAMILRRCAYWCSLHGLPPADTGTKKTIHVPRAQQFDPAALRGLMARIAGGDAP